MGNTARSTHTTDTGNLSVMTGNLPHGGRAQQIPEHQWQTIPIPQIDVSSAARLEVANDVPLETNASDVGGCRHPETWSLMNTVRSEYIADQCKSPSHHHMQRVGDNGDDKLMAPTLASHCHTSDALPQIACERDGFSRTSQTDFD